MPWIPPDSAESYLELIEAVDRERFAVHCDPVNLVRTRRVLRLGRTDPALPRGSRPVREVLHAKDIVLEPDDTGMPPMRFRERRPGEGHFDWATA